MPTRSKMLQEIIIYVDVLSKYSASKRDRIALKIV